jgi:hypothetical protein
MNEKKRAGAKSNPGHFPKGRSGNLGGRPKASRASQSSAFDILLEKTLTVSHHGGTREITAEEALQQQTFRDAVEGKRMAQREVLKWIKKRDAWRAKHAPKASWQPIKRLFSPDPDNADAALTFKISPRRLQALGLGEEQLRDSSRPTSPANVRAQIATIGEVPAVVLSQPTASSVPPAKKGPATASKKRR